MKLWKRNKDDKDADADNSAGTTVLEDDGDEPTTDSDQDVERATDDSAASTADDPDADEAEDDVDADEPAGDVRVELVVSSGTVKVEDAEYPAQANTWIIGDDEEVLVVDPGFDAAAVMDKVGEREVLMVVCTNGHANRVAAAPEVAERGDAPIALHRRDRLLWKETHTDSDAEPEIDIEAGGTFEVTGVEFRVLHTPGYTPGTVCLYSDELDIVLTGDALLRDGPAAFGDTFPDFPAQLTAIGEHLIGLPGRTRVLPARGERTTMDEVAPLFDTWVARGAEYE